MKADTLPGINGRELGIQRTSHWKTSLGKSQSHLHRDGCLLCHGLVNTVELHVMVQVIHWALKQTSKSQARYTSRWRVTKGTRQPGPIQKLEKLLWRCSLPELTTLVILTRGLWLNPRWGFSQIDLSDIPKGQYIHSAVHLACCMLCGLYHTPSAWTHFTLCHYSS